jgi:hypothetical protein
MAIVDPKSGVYKSARKAVLVRVHILGPASIAIDSRSLSVFLAVWRRGAGHVTVLVYGVLLSILSD